MWGLIIEGAILGGIYLYHRWIEDHPPGPRPSELQVPRSDEGATVPFLYGHCRVRAPVMAWVGGQRFLPRANGRFAYWLDMLYVLGVPFYGGAASLLSIYAGDIRLLLNGSDDWPPPEGLTPKLSTLPIYGPPAPARHNYFVFNEPARVFESDSEFDTVINFGFVEFWDGSPTQTLSDAINDVDPDCISDTQGALEVAPMNKIYFFINEDATGEESFPELGEDIQPTDITSFRNFATCLLYHWCNGDSANLTAYSFEVSSQSTMFVANDLTLVGADPAAVIYDLLTSPFGKLGLPASKVDSASFLAAAVTLRAERHDYSRAIEEPEDASAVISDVLRQIDGVLYEEPTTGSLVLKLVRNDYDPNALDDVNPGNARPSGSGWYQVQGWSETINQVRVSFVDIANDFAEGLAIGQNNANFFGQGNRLRSVDIRYVGCGSRLLAQKLASRELAAVSRPIVKATVIVNRAFYQTRPGDVLTLTWPNLGIDHMIMRVARVDLGQLGDGRIVLDLIRDIFDVSIGAYPVAA